MLGTLRGAEGIMVSKARTGLTLLERTLQLGDRVRGVGGGSEFSAWVDVCGGMCEGVS